MERYDVTAKPFSHKPWEYSSIPRSIGKLFLLVLMIYLWFVLPCPLWCPIEIYNFLLIVVLIVIIFAIAILVKIILICVLYDMLQREVNEAKSMAMGRRCFLNEKCREQFVVEHLPEIFEKREDIIKNWGKIQADEERMDYFQRHAKEHFWLIKTMWQEDFLRLSLAFKIHAGLKHMYWASGGYLSKELRVIKQPDRFLQRAEVIREKSKQRPLMRLTENYTIQVFATMTAVLLLDYIRLHF